jgi:uncharacterized circularly permuted ATP-grasp superfamily protein
MALFDSYATDGFYDEMFQPNGQPRPHYRRLYQRLCALSPEDLRRRCQWADLTHVPSGSLDADDGSAHDMIKSGPFDLVPRILPADEWEFLERGVKQRLAALNLFLHDIYHAQQILHDRVVPRELVVNAAPFRRELLGADPPGGIYVHICATDLIRDADGTYRVLGDDVRIPSGVSCVLANRRLLTRLLPHLFHDMAVRPVDHYATQLLHNLRQLAPPGREAEPNIVLLTPGLANSACCEDAYLAQQLGIASVEGRDLFVDAAIVYRRTPHGPQRVDVLYRRVDDTNLDPLVFRPDFLCGVPGLVNAYRLGNVTLANAIGAGVADDRVIYAYAPRIIEYYLGEKPILPNVDTYLAWNPPHRAYILANLDKLVVKAARESDGGGILIGPQASRAEREAFAARIQADPRHYIAQPFVPLSRAPAFVDGHCEGCPVDLRLYALCGKDGITLLPGALTRVARRKGSSVVNTPQGAGSKDTWVLSGNLREEPAIEPERLIGRLRADLS